MAQPSRLKFVVQGMLTLLLLVVIAKAIVGEHQPVKPGTVAPPTEATLLDGSTATLRFQKLTVVNIWATWCGPCLGEIPAFIAASRKHPEVKFVGLAAESSREDAIKTVERMKIPYDVALISDPVAAAWKAVSFPTTYLVAPDGAIRWSVRGAVDEATLEHAIADAQR